MLTLARAPFDVDMVFAELRRVQWDDLRQTHRCNFLDDIDFG